MIPHVVLICVFMVISGLSIFSCTNGSFTFQLLWKDGLNLFAHGFIELSFYYMETFFLPVFFCFDINPLSVRCVETIYFQFAACLVTLVFFNEQKFLVLMSFINFFLIVGTYFFLRTSSLLQVYKGISPCIVFQIFYDSYLLL